MFASTNEGESADRKPHMTCENERRAQSVAQSGGKPLLIADLRSDAVRLKPRRCDEAYRGSHRRTSRTQFAAHITVPKAII